MFLKNGSKYLSYFKKIDLKATGQKYEQKFKGTIVEKWITYWKNLFIDYKEVAIDVAKESKEKPLKAFSIVSSAAFIYICAKRNPDEVSYRDAIVKSASDVLLVNESQQRKESADHIRYVEKCYNADIIRRLNLGIASIIWIDDYSSLCESYQSTCTYLKFPYTEFRDRILDVGFFNKWWLLTKRMENYDINY